MQLIENKACKIVKSPEYNFMFRKADGFFARWGKTQEDDPQFSPFGPEILDLEISSGQCSGNCRFCYKANGAGQNEVNMTFGQFKTVFDKMPKILTQIAFGICDCHSNPDFFKMCRYARENGVVPNYTTNGMDVTPVVAELTARLCGAVAVSIVNKERSYDAIKMFSDAIERLGDKATLKQINVHFMISVERLEKAIELVNDLATDPRLRKVNAVVWLQYKDKIGLDTFHSVTDVEVYKKLIQHCESKGIGYGFDSCSAHLFIKSIQGRDNAAQLESLAEPCESRLFSFYINCKGVAFPCSFCEEVSGWEEGVSVLDCEDFVKDVWNHPKFQAWKEKLLTNDRRCPVYNI